MVLGVPQSYDYGDVLEERLGRIRSSRMIRFIRHAWIGASAGFQRVSCRLPSSSLISHYAIILAAGSSNFRQLAPPPSSSRVSRFRCVIYEALREPLVWFFRHHADYRPDPLFLRQWNEKRRQIYEPARCLSSRIIYYCPRRHSARSREGLQVYLLSVNIFNITSVSAGAGIAAFHHIKPPPAGIIIITHGYLLDRDNTS